jgi:hypothetical protein
MRGMQKLTDRYCTILRDRILYPTDPYSTTHALDIGKHYTTRHSFYIDLRSSINGDRLVHLLQ